MLSRILEDEVMDTAEDAADYDAMDFATVNAAFAEECLASFPNTVTTLLDLGTGTARIPIEIAKRSMNVHITAVDLSAEMLKLGHVNVTRAGLADRIELKLVDAKMLPFADASFDAVVSNSIVHHIPDPTSFFAEVVRLVRHGGRIFIRDLVRPESIESLNHLVSTYAAHDMPHQRKLFADSLHAAFTVEEIQSFIRPHGFAASTVALTSDRHWTWNASRI